MGKDKAFIREQITEQFGYDLNMTCDEIRPIINLMKVAKALYHKQ